MDPSTPLVMSNPDQQELLDSALSKSASPRPCPITEHFSPPTSSIGTNSSTTFSFAAAGRPAHSRKCSLQLSPPVPITSPKKKALSLATSTAFEEIRQSPKNSSPVRSLRSPFSPTWFYQGARRSPLSLRSPDSYFHNHSSAGIVERSFPLETDLVKMIGQPQDRLHLWPITAHLHRQLGYHVCTLQVQPTPNTATSPDSERSRNPLAHCHFILSPDPTSKSRLARTTLKSLGLKEKIKKSGAIDILIQGIPVEVVAAQKGECSVLALKDFVVSGRLKTVVGRDGEIVIDTRY